MTKNISSLSLLGILATASVSIDLVKENLIGKVVFLENDGDNTSTYKNGEWLVVDETKDNFYAIATDKPARLRDIEVFAKQNGKHKIVRVIGAEVRDEIIDRVIDEQFNFGNTPVAEMGDNLNVKHIYEEGLQIHERILRARTTRQKFERLERSAKNLLEAFNV